MSREFNVRSAKDHESLNLQRPTVLFGQTRFVILPRLPGKDKVAECQFHGCRIGRVNQGVNFPVRTGGKLRQEHNNTWWHNRFLKSLFFKF
jgi:hypothetical protein